MGTVLVRTVRAKAMIDTPPMGRGRVMQAIMVATKRANMCQPATGMPAGLKLVKLHRTRPTIRGRTKPR
ncbi:hypothetical protein SN4111_14670 [Ligilactobacillus agilis]|nr:hypothetical protein SN4111_14670 [Ligilactobacillus agilis]